MAEISKNMRKAIRRLHQKKYRTELGESLVSGTKITEELLQHQPECILNIFLSEKAPQRLREMAEKSGLNILIGSPDDISQLSPLTQMEGALVHFRIPTPPTPAFSQWNRVLICDRIADPGNLGTLVRLVDWFNWDALVCTPGSVEFFNPKTVQASMGSIFRKIPFTMNPHELITQLNTNNFSVLMADMQGMNYNEVRTDTAKTALILGSESHGPGDYWPDTVRRVTIPRYGRAESLNVAMAASILVARFTQG